MKFFYRRPNINVKFIILLWLVLCVACLRNLPFKSLCSIFKDSNSLLSYFLPHFIQLCKLLGHSLGVYSRAPASSVFSSPVIVTHWFPTGISWDLDAENTLQHLYSTAIKKDLWSIKFLENGLLDTTENIALLPALKDPTDEHPD